MLDGIPILSLTAPGILGLAVILLLTGYLVPRKHLADKETEILRWKKAYETEREARSAADSQTSKLLVAVEANRDVMVALLQVLRPEAGFGGSSDEVSKED